MVQSVWCSGSKVVALTIKKATPITVAVVTAGFISFPPRLIPKRNITAAATGIIS